MTATARSSRPRRPGKMIAHFDCAAGVSGDMCLGALVDAGLDLADLKAGLAGFGVRGYRLRARSVRRAGLRGTQIEVVVPREGRRGRHDRQEQMTLGRMITMTRSSRLPERVKTQAVAVFTRLRAVEAKVHGHHTGAHIAGAGGAWGGHHALGTPDTVIDVVGTVLGLHLLGVGPGSITASPLNTGMRLAPASAELLRGHPIYSTDLPYELTTPTGAALITTLAVRVGPLPLMRLERVGVGAGEADPQGSPNLLRLLIGEPWPAGASRGAMRTSTAETILQVETDIDDLNPQVYEYLMGRLLRAGALDVTLTPLIMKKGRPGTRVTVLARPADLTALAGIVFDETTTLGMRVHEVQRLRLPRTIRTLKTRAGSVRVKVAARDGRLSATPEYEDCRRIAQRTGRPLTQVMDEIRQRVRLPLNLTFSPKGRRKR